MRSLYLKLRQLKQRNLYIKYHTIMQIEKIRANMGIIRIKGYLNDYSSSEIIL